MNLRKLTAPLVGALVVIALLAVPALAAAPVKSKLKITNAGTGVGNSMTIDGTLNSSKAACEKGRAITLKLPKGDEGQTFSPAVTKTATDGTWQVVLPTAGSLSGTYKAKAAAKKAGKSTCKASSSKPYVYEH